MAVLSNPSRGTWAGKRNAFASSWRSKMTLNSLHITSRDMQILAGLFLSKFDKEGLAALGFGSFNEAFNALGYGLGGRPASIKNYRDEFDPMFPNPRSGWWKRQRRDYCMAIEKQSRHLCLEDFAKLVSSFVGVSRLPGEPDDLAPTSFAKRLITGRAAEQYFQRTHSSLEEFQDCEIEDTTMQGCGYDFRAWPKSGSDYRAVEVKGMIDQSGRLSLTSKEHATAADLGERFYLFVVKNFREKPFHELHPDPLKGQLRFERQERIVIQVSWSADV